MHFFKKSLIPLLFLFLSFFSHAANLQSQGCIDLFNFPVSEPVQSAQLESKKIEQEIAQRLQRVYEFQFIRDEAKKRGLRVWIFGGTAASFAHYVKWDLLRELGDSRFQSDRFDYEYSSIYRSTQDLDIVINGSAQDAIIFEQILKNKFPYLSGEKTIWEVRSLTEAKEDKGGLMGDFGFMNQHTDSNSTGLIELTSPLPGESIIRDLRNWNSIEKSKFLNDITDQKLTFYHSDRHSETPRAQSGENPPIFSVIRALIKAFQFDLQIQKSDLDLLQKEIDKFDPKTEITQPYAENWIEKNGKKLFQNALDVETAWNVLDSLGLRKKLISLRNNPKTIDSLSWWMNKEPLRKSPIGEGEGRTAQSLGIDVVAHETRDFHAYESITLAPTGLPNVFSSRHNAIGESAIYGEGFYTAKGSEGAARTGITIRFRVDPKAREGSDFVLGYHQIKEDGTINDGAFVIWKNRSALQIIPESLQISALNYFESIAQGKTYKNEDRALFWKFKRKLDHQILSNRISQGETDEIRKIIQKHFIDRSPYRETLLKEWVLFEGARLKKSTDVINKWIYLFKNKYYGIDPAPVFATLVELTNHSSLNSDFRERWFSSILKELETDVSDRALENALFSPFKILTNWAQNILEKRLEISPTPFLKSLQSIFSYPAYPGDSIKWLQSDLETQEQIKEKATYLVHHPELRKWLTQAMLQKIESDFLKESFLPIFEQKSENPITDIIKSESFRFVPLPLEQPIEIQATPVTQLQWALITGENPSRYHENGKWIRIYGKEIEMQPNHPVEQVSWDKIQIFIHRLNQLDPLYHYRLPTETEWKFAARGLTTFPFPQGYDTEKFSFYAWTRENSEKETHEVASLKPNPLGLYDVYGNIWEWTEDQINRDSDLTLTSPPNLMNMTSEKILLGGSYLHSSKDGEYYRRLTYLPNYGLHFTGFRLVRIPKF